MRLKLIEGTKKTVLAQQFQQIALPLWIPILLSIVSLVFLPNMGGGALSLPYSLLAWCVILLTIIWGFYRIVVTNKVIFSGGIQLLFIAGLLLTLPLFWTPTSVLKMAALPRLFAIWLSLIALFALLQGKISINRERTLLQLLLVGSILQACLVIAQLFAPHWVNFIMSYDQLKTGGRPYGIFQQYNLLGSFLATGIGISVYLIITEPLGQMTNRANSYLSVTYTFLKRYSYSFALFILWSAIIWSQSRIGLLGAILMTLLALINRFSQKIWLPTLLGILSGVILPYTPFWTGFIGVDFLHKGANVERLTLLIGTLKLILEHPWLGHGLATFETHWVLPNIPIEGVSASFTHPHNELLYVWSEGGVIALIGFLLIPIVWLSSIVSWGIQRGHFSFKASLLRTLLPLPIALHLMTEYPLYQSIPHLLLLLILWRVVWNEARLRIYEAKGRLKKIVRIIAVLGILTALLGVVSCIGGLYVQHQLTRLEENGLRSVKVVRSLEALPSLLTWTQQQRLMYDSKTQTLLAFNSSGNQQNLLDYLQWGTQYLMQHNDSNVSAAMMLSQQLLGAPREAELIRQQAQLHYPFDSRFFLKGTSH